MHYGSDREKKENTNALTHTHTHTHTHTMMLLIREAFLLYGLRLSSSEEGGSVPRARAPIVSMIKFTHSIITEGEGEEEGRGGVGQKIVIMCDVM